MFGTHHEQLLLWLTVSAVTIFTIRLAVFVSRTSLGSAVTSSSTISFGGYLIVLHLAVAIDLLMSPLVPEPLHVVLTRIVFGVFMIFHVILSIADFKSYWKHLRDPAPKTLVLE